MAGPKTGENRERMETLGPAPASSLGPRWPAFIAPEVAQIFAEAVAAAPGFSPTPRHLALARRVSAELSAIREKGEIVSLASAVDYPALLRFLFAVFQNAPAAGFISKREPEN